MENLLIEELKIKIDHEQDTNQLFGILDVNLKIIQDNYEVDIIQRQDEITLKGKEAAKAQQVLVELLEILESGENLDAQKVNYVISLNKKGLSYKESKINKDVICFTHRGSRLNQKR